MISCIHVSTPRLFHLQGSGLARCLFLFFHVSCAGLPSAARPAEDTIFMSAGLKDADSLGFMVMVVQVVMTAVSIPLMDAWPCLIGFGSWRPADTNNPETKEASCTERLVVSVDFLHHQGHGWAKIFASHSLQWPGIWGAFEEQNGPKWPLENRRRMMNQWINLVQ